jgi:hypothetical protein
MSKIDRYSAADKLAILLMKYEDALQDRRGRQRKLEELSDDEKQKLVMKKFEYENERLRAENALLKKIAGTRGKAILSQIRHEKIYLTI